GRQRLLATSSPTSIPNSSVTFKARPPALNRNTSRPNPTYRGPTRGRREPVDSAFVRVSRSEYARPKSQYGVSLERAEVILSEKLVETAASELESLVAHCAAVLEVSTPQKTLAWFVHRSRISVDRV